MIGLNAKAPHHLASKRPLCGPYDLRGACDLSAGSRAAPRMISAGRAVNKFIGARPFRWPPDDFRLQWITVGAAHYALQLSARPLGRAEPSHSSGEVSLAGRRGTSLTGATLMAADRRPCLHA